MKKAIYFLLAIVLMTALGGCNVRDNTGLVSPDVTDYVSPYVTDYVSPNVSPNVTNRVTNPTGNDLVTDKDYNNTGTNNKNVDNGIIGRS